VGRFARFRGAATSGPGKSGVRGGACFRQGRRRPRTHRCLDDAFAAHSCACLGHMGEHYIHRTSFIGSFAESCRLIDFIPKFSTALLYFDAATVHFASAISIILVFYSLYAFVGRNFTAGVSQIIALQVRCTVPPGLLVISHDRE
jgi:hypothetical protein